MAGQGKISPRKTWVLLTIVLLISGVALAQSVVQPQNQGKSAINADKLDGYDAAAFLSTSGGTLTGDLDMNGNNILNCYKIDGARCSNLGQTQNLSQTLQVNNNMAGYNINASGSRIINVTAVKPGDAVNKSYVDTSDDTVADDQNLSDVLSRGNSAGDYDIYMGGSWINGSEGHRIDFSSSNGANSVITTGDTAGEGWIIRNKSNSADLIRLKTSGNVEIPNGNLDVKSGNDVRFFSGGNSQWEFIHQPANDRFKLIERADHNTDVATFNSGGPIKFLNPVTANPMLVMNNSGGDSVEVPNGDFEVSNSDLLVDSSANVVRTPNAGLRVESGDTASSGSGLELRYSGGEGTVIARNASSGNYLPLKLIGEDITLDGSRYAGGSITVKSANLNISDNRIEGLDQLRATSGQKAALEAGDGTNALSWTSSYDVLVPNGKLDLSGNNLDMSSGGNIIGSSVELQVGGNNYFVSMNSGTNSVQVADTNGNSLLNIRDGGPVKIQNANLDMGGNTIVSSPPSDQVTLASANTPSSNSVRNFGENIFAFENVTGDGTSQKLHSERIEGLYVVRGVRWDGETSTRFTDIVVTTYNTVSKVGGTGRYNAPSRSYSVGSSWGFYITISAGGAKYDVTLHSLE